MPQPPNPPRAPGGPRAPNAPAPTSLRFSSVRNGQSVALDSRELRPRGHEPSAMPPYEHWPEFRRYLRQTWTVGPPNWPNSNVAIVGTAGSGKTTLARDILQLRDYVCVFGTKRSDASLYAPMEKLGYKIRDEWSPERTDEPRVIFRPPLSAPTPQALNAQREAFQKALLSVFQTGGWTLYFDEVRYLTETLKLATELNLLWLQGRSEGVTIVASTQRPVSVPLNMFEQAHFFFLARISGAEDRKTAAAYTGPSAPVVYEAVATLPPHEFLFIDNEMDVLVRTKVER
jgi:hypothetical protein